MNLEDSIRIQKQIYGGSFPLWAFLYYANWALYYVNSKRKYEISNKLVGLTNFFYSGNPRAVLEYALEREDERFYWVCRDFITLKKLKSSGINAYMINDPSIPKIYAKTGLWGFAHTGFLNLPPFVPETYVKFLLWHGIGPKRGLGREIFNWADYFLTTTENLRERYYEKFGIPKEKVVAFGYPRLDRLLKFLKKDKLEVAAEMGLKSDAINVLYAPTYNAGLGLLRNPDLLRFLVRELSKRNMNFILRLHPFTRFSGGWKIVDNFSKKFENFFLMDMFVEPDTEKVLYIADLLVTDWSSIYTDYLVLDRPVVFLDVPHPKVGPDFISDIPQDARPGPKVTQEKLIKAIVTELENPNSSLHERRKVLKLAHGEPDGKASERVYNFILKFIQ